jgi:hypothetical protein
MVSNFIPEIWAANILEHLRAILVYGSPTVVNRDYEGEIREAGDTVHITSFTDPTIRDYTPETNITVESISDATLALVIDQMKYFAFDVDDVIRRQAINGWVTSVTRAAAYKLLDKVDTYISGIMYTAVNGTANDIGAVTADVSDNNTYGSVLVALRATLNANNVPSTGRWVVVPSSVYGALLQDNRFIDASASGSTDALRNGFVGRAAGFDVFESNTVPTETTGVYSVIAGHNMATTYAEQINSVEAQRRELRFGDLVKGLHLYGAKVTRPEALALASVTVQA